VAKERGRKPIAVNRRARHEYHIEDTVEAGIVLRGTEGRAGRTSPTATPTSRTARPGSTR